MLAKSSKEVKNRLIPWLKPDGIWSAPAFRAASQFQMTYGQSALFIKEDELEEFIQQLKKEGWA
jgi:hypothetical protein